MSAVFPSSSSAPRQLASAVGCCLALSLLLAGACHSNRPRPESTGTTDSESRSAPIGTDGDAEATGARAEGDDDAGGELRDPATGVQLNFPVGWTVETERDALPASAKGPGPAPVRMSLRSWDGDVAALESSVGDSLTHLSSGPYASLETLADAPPLVHSTPYADDAGALAFAWFFTVGGQGLVVEARIPAADFERGWRQVDAIVRSASRSLGGS